MDNDSLLLQISPVLLLCGAIVICLWAFFAVWKYRGTNDFSKSCKLYFIGAVPYIAVFTLLKLPVFLCLLCVAAGFVVLSAVSNHYFYHL